VLADPSSYIVSIKFGTAFQINSLKVIGTLKNELKIYLQSTDIFQ